MTRVALSNPVFVVGSPRSGTTLLYHTLLSSGSFAVYRAETHIFTTVGYRFDLRRHKDRGRLLDAWMRSDLFRLSGLDPDHLRDRVMRGCRNHGDFLRVFMESIARRQGRARWAEKTPEHLLYAAEIKRMIPDALFLHIIRDGRDVAASLGALGYIPVLPWHKHGNVLAAGLYWEWLLRQGRKIAQSLGPDYLEVRYEDLITNPQPSLDRIGAFIGCPLDYAQIRRAAIGAVAQPNTAFLNFNGPFIGRWKALLPPSDARRLEEMIAPTLEELGYPPELVAPGSGRSLASWRMRTAYHSLFRCKKWLKQHAPFNRMVRLNPLRPGFVCPSSSQSGLARARHAG